MTLDWQISDHPDSKNRIYTTFCEEGTQNQIIRAIEACIEKAITHFPENVFDDSRFCLFNWDKQLTTLSIAVSDETKTIGQQALFKCTLPTLKDSKESTEDLKYWINDYLSTSPSFCNFSLIALFQDEYNQQSSLL